MSADGSGAGALERERVAAPAGAATAATATTASATVSRLPRPPCTARQDGTSTHATRRRRVARRGTAALMLIVQESRAEERRGIVYGLSAYLLWGLFPLFFRLLDSAGPIEILAHRIVWSL